MKRIFLFLLTNIAVMLVLGIVFSIICALLGINSAMLEKEGINYIALLVFSIVFGIGGSIISLLLSKSIAKWSTKAHVITGAEGPAEAWLVQTIGELAQQANIGMPEVAIYPGDANAFATGAFRNSALVAVSTGIMEQMTKSELRAVLGHEISHVANGDMVTLTLIQGVLNVFVLFFSRMLGYLANSALSRDNRRGGGMIYHLITMILQLVLGILASLVVMAYSRHREYAADAGSAKLLGSPSDMIAALTRLNNLTPGVLPDSLKAMGINGKSARDLFASHPPIEDRIAALRAL